MFTLLCKPTPLSISRTFHHPTQIPCTNTHPSRQGHLQSPPPTAAMCSVLGMSMARLRWLPSILLAVGQVNAALPLNTLEKASVLMAISVSSSQKEKAGAIRQLEAHRPPGNKRYRSVRCRRREVPQGLLTNMQLCMSWELNTVTTSAENFFPYKVFYVIYNAE